MQLPAQWQAGIDRNTEVLRGHAQLLASFTAPRPTQQDSTTPRGQIASIVSTTRSQPTLTARHATQTLTHIHQANDSLRAITRLLPARAAADAARVQA
ncbi:AtzE family amidohydrolase, partial [Xanthomonas hortorum pv. gardneri]